MLTYEFDGINWGIPNPAAIIAEYEAKPPIGRAKRFLFCTRCKTICTVENNCTGCQDWGKSFAGSKRVRSFCALHVRLEAAPIVAFLRERLAA